MNFREKLVAWEELSNWRASLKAEGRKLVVTNGCFDLLHVGHVTYLQAVDRSIPRQIGRQFWRPWRVSAAFAFSRRSGLPGFWIWPNPTFMSKAATIPWKRLTRMSAARWNRLADGL